MDKQEQAECVLNTTEAEAQIHGERGIRCQDVQLCTDNREQASVRQAKSTMRSVKIKHSGRGWF